MKAKKKISITMLLVVGSLQLLAQKDKSAATDIHNYNFIKFNLAGVVVKNYSFQYERILNRKFSAALSFRVMPSTSLPFKNVINSYIGNSFSDTKDLINNLQVSDFAITPEFRIYLSKKGSGHGFYIAPFYRYASFSSNRIKVNYTDDLGASNSLNLTGKLTANTAGFLVGAQWTVHKNICIDWSIAGPHYGGGNGNFNGASARPLTLYEQAQIRNQLDNVTLPFINKTVSVNANGATMLLSGPWAGIRAALAIGVAF